MYCRYDNIDENITYNITVGLAMWLKYKKLAKTSTGFNVLINIGIKNVSVQAY